jgi:hypothetical protein
MLWPQKIQTQTHQAGVSACVSMAEMFRFPLQIPRIADAGCSPVRVARVGENRRLAAARFERFQRRFRRTRVQVPESRHG